MFTLSTSVCSHRRHDVLEGATISTQQQPRPYHHGDLKAALVAAGLELVRHEGPDALGLREASRTVGVTPNAVYRHFRDRAALALAVAEQAQEKLADLMRHRVDAIDTTDAADRATGRLRAIGLAYVEFARHEPGLFQLAFRSHEQLAADTDRIEPAPFRMLNDALDELVDVGLLPSARREHAEWAAWSAVHGFADLATRGPLHAQPGTITDMLASLVVDRAITGILGTDSTP